MVRILIVDDHVVVREGLKQFLAETPDMTIAGEASCAREALAMVKSGQWDLVLLDIAMPDQNGLAALKRIKREKPGLPVLIFSNFSEDEYALSSLRAGAAGYLSKDSTPEQLREAIRRLVQGGRYVGPGLAEKLLSDSVPNQEQAAHERLSRREYDILIRIAGGRSLTQIGEDLHLSVKTIGTYRKRILEKMAMGSNAELTRYVVKHRLDE